MKNHFKDHKQRYISFGVVAIFIIFITYVVYRSEAAGFPLSQGAAGSLTRTNNCPPPVRRFPEKFPNHPCMREVDQLKETSFQALVRRLFHPLIPTTTDVSTVVTSDVEASSSASSTQSENNATSSLDSTSTPDSTSTSTPAPISDSTSSSSPETSDVPAGL